MSSKTQQKDIISEFAEVYGVTHTTFTTSISLPGNIDVYQIQLDTTTAPSNTSFQVANGSTVLKYGAFSSGAATREITWVGRAFSFDGGSINLSRPLGDTHDVHCTIIFRRRA